MIIIFLRRWYISAVPPGQSPGTRKDFDYYAVHPTNHESSFFPPKDGWLVCHTNAANLVCGFGKYPPPNVVPVLEYPEWGELFERFGLGFAPTGVTCNDCNGDINDVIDLNHPWFPTPWQGTCHDCLNWICLSCCKRRCKRCGQRRCKKCMGTKIPRMCSICEICDYCTPRDFGPCGVERCNNCSCGT